MRARAAARSLAFGLCFCLTASCVSGAPADAELEAALGDLARAGFEFEADVRFAVDRYASCDGIACADLTVMRGRRTVRIAEAAFDSPVRLRASLLEIWERYRQPRPRSTPDLARAAQRVLRDGPRVGVNDPAVLRRAHHRYRRLWQRLPPEQRSGLVDPDALDYP